MEHLGDELDARWFVRVRFLEVHDEFEGAVFEGCVLVSSHQCLLASYLLVVRIDRDSCVCAVALL